jgi:hypothetical protein
MAHVLEHDAVVGGVEGSFEVLVHSVDIFVVQFSVLYHHDDGGKSVMDAAEDSKAVLLRIPWDSA